ncbi:MAG: M20/M25/M40 family metallo-hydrolase [Bdellovibrionales bacterium]|nr:M20/M25/M40 family metallo-hydrolase [Bdellovibrionales bacterium]
MQFFLQQREISNVERLSENALRLTSELIRIRSDGSELGVAQHLQGLVESRFQRFSPDIQIQNFVENRANLFIRFGVPSVVFSTHMDTVAPDIQMNLLNPRFEDNGEVLFGRGACDAKGIIAAIIESSHYLLENGYSNFGLLFVGDEEQSHLGARAAATWLKNAEIEYLINGEPTEGMIAVGHLGGVKMRVEVAGVSSHSGSPQFGINAASRLRRLLSHWEDLALLGELGAHPQLGVSSMNVYDERILTGGDNMVPHSAEASFFARPVVTVEEFIALLQSCGDAYLDTLVSQERPHKSPSMYEALEATRFSLAQKPEYKSYDPWNSRLQVNGAQTVTMPYGTDLPYLQGLARVGCVLTGPGSIQSAHSDFEHITRTQMRAGIETYVSLAQSLALLL